MIVEGSVKVVRVGPVTYSVSVSTGESLCVYVRIEIAVAE